MTTQSFFPEGNEPLLTATYRGPGWGSERRINCLRFWTRLWLLGCQWLFLWGSPGDGAPPGCVDVSVSFATGPRWWGYVCCVYGSKRGVLLVIQKIPWDYDDSDYDNDDVYFCIFYVDIFIYCKYIGDDGFITCLHLSRWDFGKSCHPTTRDILRAQKEAGNVFGSISPGVSDDVHASTYRCVSLVSESNIKRIGRSFLGSWNFETHTWLIWSIWPNYT